MRCGIARSWIIRGRVTLPTAALVRSIRVCLRPGLQIISARRETEDPIFAEIVGAGATTGWQELTLAGHVSVFEDLDGNVWHGLAIFIHHSAGDHGLRHQPQNDIA